MADDIDSKKPEEQVSANETEATIETVSAETEAPAGDTGVEKETTSKQDDDLLSMLKGNHSLLQEIKGVIQNRLEYDAVKEKAFDKLYEEMRQQKDQSDLIDRNIKPLLTDLLLLYDSIENFEVSLSSQENSNNERFIRDFKYRLEDLLEILYRHDVIPIEDDDSGKFNPKLHKAIKIENAESQDDDFRIIKIIRRGFLWRDKVLRPQEVIIKRFLDKNN